MYKRQAQQQQAHQQQAHQQQAHQQPAHQQQAQQQQLLAAAPLQQAQGLSHLLIPAASTSSAAHPSAAGPSSSSNSNGSITAGAPGATAATNIATAPPHVDSHSLFWQQAIQSLNFIPQTITTQHQPSYLPGVAAAGGASLAAFNHLGMTGAMLPQQQQLAVGQQLAPIMPALVSQATNLGGVVDFSQIAANPAAVSATSKQRKRKEPSKTLEQHRQQHQASSKFAKTRNTATRPGTLSVVSSSHSSASDQLFAQPPPVKLSDVDLNRLHPTERRRYERNLREQQRSYGISQQMKLLRDVLAASNVPFQPNKLSILVSVADYIKELQARTITLDEDHKRLADSIRQTNELVTSRQVPFSEESNSSNNSSNPSLTSLLSEDFGLDSLLVKGIDYQAVFQHCPYPLGVASLDGRILACNHSFERALGCLETGEMVQQSLFLYVRNHQEIFEAMADLLKRSSMACEMGDEGVSQEDDPILYWCGQVMTSTQQEVRLCVSVLLFYCIVASCYISWACSQQLCARFSPSSRLQLAISISLTGAPDGDANFFRFYIAAVE
jgi:PAS domain-containing protein